MGISAESDSSLTLPRLIFQLTASFQPDNLCYITLSIGYAIFDNLTRQCLGPSLTSKMERSFYMPWPKLQCSLNFASNSFKLKDLAHSRKINPLFQSFCA
jgi:hypothetical protein